MKLLRSIDVLPDGSGLVCRQGRLPGTIMAAVFTVLFAGPAVAAWWLGIPKFFAIVLSIAALILVPMLVGDVRARYRATNWLLWIRRDGLSIHFRSYQDRSPQDALTVLDLGYSEIAEVREYVEHYTTPDSDGDSVHHKLRSLEIHLLAPDTGELETALAENRRREQPERTYFGFISSRARLTHFSVTLPAPDVIRIAWRGGQSHCVTPSLRRVLDALAEHVTVGEPLSDDRQSWKQLTDEELDTQILAFVEAGNRMEATNLLVRRRGYSLTKAHKFIEELSRRV